MLKRMNPTTKLIEGKAALRIALRRFPDLTGNGTRASDFGGAAADKPWHPGAMAEIETALAFLRLLKPSKARFYSSYCLKHIAEQWGRSTGREPYICNGALIAAAVALDFPIRMPVFQCPNLGVGVCKRELRSIATQFNWYL